MDERGWTIDPASLREVVTDRPLAEANLRAAAGPERLFWLRVLGRLDEAAAEADRLLAEPIEQADPWRLLVEVAEILRYSRRIDTAEEFLQKAWRIAYARRLQGETLHRLALCRLEFGDQHAAAQSFVLARTMLGLFGAQVASAITRIDLGLQRIRGHQSFDAVVLSGGASRRMGGRDKTAARIAGWPLLDHVLLAASAATNRIVVGPNRTGLVLGEPEFCREEPPGAGPVAAVAAALPRVEQPLVALLAGDLPFIARAIDELLLTVRTSDRAAAALVDTTGSINYLAAVWRTDALRAAIARLPSTAGAPVKALYADADPILVPDFDACGADCDTPAQLRDARERITRRSPGRLPTSLLAWPRLELHAPS